MVLDGFILHLLLIEKTVSHNGVQFVSLMLDYQTSTTSFLAQRTRHHNEWL